MRGRVLCAATACGVLIAACGGSSHGSGGGKKTAGPYGPRSSPYSLSKCMRANGVTRFPDPSQGSGGIGFPGGVVVSVEGELTVDGVTFSGPAFRRASRACSTYLPGGGGPPPAMSASEKAAALKLARCMRAHGVPSFPDPGSNFGGAGGANKQVPIPGADSPAFKRAVDICGRGGGISIRAGNAQGP